MRQIIYSVKERSVLLESNLITQIILRLDLAITCVTVVQNMYSTKHLPSDERGLSISQGEMYI